MHFAALSTALLAFVHSALAAPVENQPSLDVTLTQAGNTNIKAVVKNTGNEDVTFVHLNFFRDNGPVQKVTVHRDGMFTALEMRLRTDVKQPRNWSSRASGAAISLMVLHRRRSPPWLLVRFLRMSLMLPPPPTSPKGVLSLFSLRASYPL